VHNESKQLYHLDEALFEPVRGVLDMLPPFYFCPLHPVKDKYNDGMQSKETAEPVEQRAHFGVLASIMVTVTKYRAALDNPDTAHNVSDNLCAHKNLKRTWHQHQEHMCRTSFRTLT
jgi:hypothetical protein